MVHKPVVPLVALMILASATVCAQLLYQPPNQVSGTFSDEGFDVFLDLYGHSQSVAENFIVNLPGGGGYQLGEVVVWGGFDPYMGSAFPTWNDVDVLIHADDNGLPGTVLCSEENVSVTRVATGQTIGTSIDEYMVTATLAAPCGLSGGLYWIEVFFNTTVGYDDWIWEWGEMGVFAGIPTSAYAEENPGQDWGTIPSFEHAVMINGTEGHVHCVQTPAELQAALSAAGSSIYHDVIQVVQGTFVTPGAPFSYSTTNSGDLQVLGGFLPGCTDRQLMASNTVLDGGGTTSVMSIEAAPTTNGSMLVQGLSFTGGSADLDNTAGLRVGGDTSYGGFVIVDRNIFTDNHSAGGDASLTVTSDNGMVWVTNNLLAGNTSDTGRGAGLVDCSGEATWITNNTVTNNVCSSCPAALETTGALSPYFGNNILWGNGSTDLAFANSALLMHNDLGSYSGTQSPGSAGNLSVDPIFEAAGIYRLLGQSPLIDQGTNNPAGGLADSDLDGRNRLQAGQVDIGAYESPVFFFSSFDDIYLRDWSVVVGGVTGK